MGIVLWIVLGIVTGSLARKVMPGPPAGGMAIAISVAVVGALLGGFLSTVFSGGSVADVDAYSLLMAISGTLILLLCYRSFAMRAIA